jgi:hypothetical protein
MYRTELLVCGVPFVIIFGSALLLIYLQKKEEKRGKSRYKQAYCDHNWNLVQRTESVGLGSPDFNHYVCRKCGEKKATPIR